MWITQVFHRHARSHNHRSPAPLRCNAPSARKSETPIGPDDDVSASSAGPQAVFQIVHHASVVTTDAPREDWIAASVDVTKDAHPMPETALSEC